MPLTDFDVYMRGFFTSIASAPGPTRQLISPGGDGTSTINIVRPGQSGSLRGMISVTNLGTIHLLGGVSVMQSQRNIAAGNGTFYALGTRGGHAWIMKYVSGSSNPSLALTLGFVNAVSVPGGDIRAAWDANLSGLGGTRLTLHIGGALIFDIVDTQQPYLSSLGEGLFMGDTGGGFSEAANIYFATYSSAGV